jgi:lincosamide nucleotidyltransferase A/C/D/E
MVSAEDAILIYQLLLENGIQLWLTGGWGIDALLGEQTRPHKDLDVILLLDDVVRTQEILGDEGYSLKMLWEEDRPAVDSMGNQVATAFVLHDPDGREFDAHAMVLDELGNGIPAWEGAEGFLFSKNDLSGIGRIDGYEVQCITAESQMVCHTGYEVPEKQRRDLERLQEVFGVEYPDVNL